MSQERTHRVDSKTPSLISASNALQRISEKLAAVENARGTRPIEHVVRQDLRPEIFDVLRLREEAVPADVEMKTLVGGRARNAADIDRVGFEHRDVDVVLGKKVRRRQSSRTRANNCYVSFHVCLSYPVAPVKFQTYHPWTLSPAALSSANRRHAKCTHQQWRGAELMQKMDKCQHD